MSEAPKRYRNGKPILGTVHVRHAPEPSEGPSELARQELAKRAGRELAELADEILSSDGDQAVYEDEMARLRINAASIVYRALLQADRELAQVHAIPADTLDLVAMDAQVIRDCVRRSSSAPNVLQTIDYIAERMLAALDALRAAREGAKR